MSQSKNIKTVSELTSEIKNFLEESFYEIVVQGEISNFKNHSSGHKYFNIKDDNAIIACTMWKSRPISFIPKDGMKVVIYGRLTVYPPRGNYQIEVNFMNPLGLGDLYLAFEQLKNKLSELGYFDTARKRKLPLIPLKIGVSTSPTGAAIEDIKNTIFRRFPNATIYFRPTLVQGEGSQQDIANAIEELNKFDCDVIIIGRGGGSIEDLWSYNTEIVANAIFNSKSPIISAVGHETDFTIADFVADLRAATPTAAAELSTPLLQKDIYDFLQNFNYQSNLKIKKIISDLKKNIDNLTQSYSFRIIKDKLNYNRQYLDDLYDNLISNITNTIDSKKEKIKYLNSHLNSLEPLVPLKKGFALLKYKNEYIKKNHSLANFKEIEIIRVDEISKVKILEVSNKLF